MAGRLRTGDLRADDASGDAGAQGEGFIPAAPAPDDQEAAEQDAADWPLKGWVDDMRPALAQARGAGRPCALATICATGGSAPRPVGAQMLVGDEVVGHLSGGCIEGDVAVHARACLADGEPRRLVYGQGSPWRDIRLACGGRLDVLVERIPPDDDAVGSLLRLADARRPAVLASDGTARRVAADGPPTEPSSPDYVVAYAPATRLIVVGRDPTALAMCAAGLQVGFEVTLVTPHGPPSPPPLEGLRYLRSSPAEALSALGPDRWTAVAVATHDADWDEEALAAALPSAAAYVGALGARSRLDDRRARLRAMGLAAGALDRLHAPIGRPGYGKAPWAIAVSTVSEVLQVMAQAGDGARGG